MELKINIIFSLHAPASQPALTILGIQFLPIFIVHCICPSFYALTDEKKFMSCTCTGICS